MKIDAFIMVPTEYTIFFITIRICIRKCDNNNALTVTTLCFSKECVVVSNIIIMMYKVLNMHKNVLTDACRIKSRKIQFYIIN